MRRKRYRHNVWKRCKHKPRDWPKCSDAWYFGFTPRGGKRQKFSLDAELGRHVDSATGAQEHAATIKAAMLAGTFIRAAARRRAEQVPTATPDTVTFRTFGDVYIERHAKTCGKRTWKNDRGMLNRLCSFALPAGLTTLGDKALGAITEDDVEAFFAQLRQQGTAASTRNKYVQLVKALFRWATKKGYLSRSPVADSETIRREKMAQRSRRLEPDLTDGSGKLVRHGEERRLLQFASPQLQRLIIGALETGCRRGELLTLRWADADLHKRELTVRAEHAKDREQRILPISSRLAGVLEMARTDPADREYPPTACVFGELGRPLKTIKKAWETAVLKAHGHEPRWEAGGGLSSESRARLRQIDLHFHDLRHEAGSRLIERGWPIHHVQEMLGHASLEQTSTYLNVTRAGLHESMRKFENIGNAVPTESHVGNVEHPPLGHGDPKNAAEPLVN